MNHNVRGAPQYIVPVVAYFTRLHDKCMDVGPPTPLYQTPRLCVVAPRCTKARRIDKVWKLVPEGTRSASGLAITGADQFCIGDGNAKPSIGSWAGSRTFMSLLLSVVV